MMASRVHQHYRCSFEAGTDKLDLEVTGLDVRHGAVHFLTSEPGMAMALKHGINADVLHEFPGNLDPSCLVQGPGWAISIKLASLIKPVGKLSDGINQ